MRITVLSVMPLLAPLIFSCGTNKKSYIVEFTSNSTSEVPSQVIKHGDTATEPELPPRDNYTFQGWYYDNRTFEYRFDFNTPICSNLKLFGKWEHSYPVIFSSTNLDIDKTSVPRLEDLVCNITIKDGLSSDDYEIPVAKDFYTVTIGGKLYDNFTIDTIYSTEDNYTTRLTIKKADIKGPIGIKVDAYEKYLTFSPDESDAKLSYTCTTEVNLQYKQGVGEWTEWAKDTPIDVTEPIKVRGTKVPLSSATNKVTFVSQDNKKIKVSGDVTSLISFGYPSSYCFDSLFKNFPLTTLPMLPSVAVGDHCYQNMFNNCDYITSTPLLPATTLAEGCYSNMFNGCDGLVIAYLPAKSLPTRAYEGMFNGCSQITSVTVGFGTKDKTDWPGNNATDSWLPDLTSSPGQATLYWHGTDETTKLEAAGLLNSVNYIPTGWGVDYIE